MHRISFGRSRCGSKVRRTRLIGLERMEPRVLLSTYTVVNTTDADPGSLRWAILQANQGTGPCSIVFDLPGPGVQTISVQSPLPTIIRPVVIDGTSGPGYTGQLRIQVDGRATAGADGLVLAGGSSHVKGLVITRFQGAGIVLQGGGGNVVQGNALGTDRTGRAALPNRDGVLVVGSSANTIGGMLAGEGNLISGNSANGIEIRLDSQDLDSAGNVILGNLIGTTAERVLGPRQCGRRHPHQPRDPEYHRRPGQRGRQRDLGQPQRPRDQLLRRADAHPGQLDRHDGRRAECPREQARRDLSRRLLLQHDRRRDSQLRKRHRREFRPWHRHGAGASGNAFQGNFIGTDRQGTLHLGNQGNGVNLGSSDNTVGGLSSGSGNTIAFNGSGVIGAGVQLVGLVDQNSILSNSIHDNAGLGINLGNGPTPNHPPDSGPGPNDFVNYPVFSSAQTDGATTTLHGSVSGAPGTSLTVQVFSSPTPDPSGFGEGLSLVGNFQTSTDSRGQGRLRPRPAPLRAGLLHLGDRDRRCGEYLGVLSRRDGPCRDRPRGHDRRRPLIPSPPGAVLTYSITVRNVGILDAHNVILTDTLPGQVTLLSATSSQGRTPFVSGQGISAALGTVPGGASAAVIVIVQVQAQAGQSLSASAQATLDELDANPANNSATATTRVATVSDLAVSLSASPSPVDLGSDLTFTVTATQHRAVAGQSRDGDASAPTGTRLQFRDHDARRGQLRRWTPHGESRKPRPGLASHDHRDRRGRRYRHGIDDGDHLQRRVRSRGGEQYSHRAGERRPDCRSCGRDPCDVGTGRRRAAGRLHGRGLERRQYLATGVSLVNVLPAGVMFVSASIDHGRTSHAACGSDHVSHRETCTGSHGDSDDHRPGHRAGRHFAGRYR